MELQWEVATATDQTQCPWRTDHAQHAGVLLDGAAAAKEAEDEDEGADCHEEVGAVLEQRLLVGLVEELDSLPDVVVQADPQTNGQQARACQL